MTAIEIARQLSELGETVGAIKAYGVAIHESGGNDPGLEMEAALYILQNGGDYKVSYSTFISLYRRGQFREDCLSVMTQAFYEPNVKLLKVRYQNNCWKSTPICSAGTFQTLNFCPCASTPTTTIALCPITSVKRCSGTLLISKSRW